MTISAAAKAAQDSARQANGEFGTQTHGDPGIVDVVDGPTRHAYGPPTGTHYVYLECENRPDIYIGPFVDEDHAKMAMDESVLVQSLAEEDCTDCFLTQDKPEDGAEHLWLADDNQRELTALLVVDGLTKTEYPTIRIDEFKGSDGMQLTAEVDTVARAIIAVEKQAGFTDEMFVTFPGDITTETGYYENDQPPSIGFTRNGFTISRPLDIYELVSRDPAPGAETVTAIAEGLLLLRDEMRIEFDTKVGAL